MNSETIELSAALRVLDLAYAEAICNASKQDQGALTAAILCRALELATPELSPRTRALLFYNDGE